MIKRHLKNLILVLTILSVFLLNFNVHASPLKVIGGGLTDPNSNSVVILRTPDGNLCSGSVISSTSILTAAHCAFIASRPGAWAIIRGVRYSLQSGRRAPSGLDVGVIKVRGRIRASRYHLAVGRLPIGQRFLVMGFGEPTPTRLSYGYMTIFEYSEDASEFAAVPFNNSAACPGDSGGPALVRFQNKDIVIGVVSRGPAGCNVNNFVVFPSTTTASITRWLVKQG